MSIPIRFVAPVALTFTLLGCSGSTGGSSVSSGASQGTGANNGTSVDLTIGGTSALGGPNGTGGNGHSDEVLTMLPDGYTASDVGGYKLG
ncbi:MAG TPA: hypothetical protein VNG33_11185, partial [Polyangiaceae bacterium]|nr:hypothetical protein [Polyangiaceae bacterium]